MLTSGARHTPFISYIPSTQSQISLVMHTGQTDTWPDTHHHIHSGWSQAPTPQMQKSFPPTPSHPCLKLEPQTLTFCEPLVLSGQIII